MYKLSIMGIKLLILLITISLFSPVTVNAAEEKPPALVSMWVMDVKAGAEKDFEAAFKAHIKVRQKEGDVRSWQVYTPHTGSHFNRYYVRYCCFKWADQDAYEKWSNNSKVMDDWEKGAGQYVERYAHHYSWVDMENSHWKEGQKYQFIGVRSFYLKPGSDVGESVKELSSLAKEVKWDRSWSWAYSVSGASELNLAFPFENFAAMQPPEPSFGELAAKHLGSEDKVKEIFKRFDENFHKTKYTIYRHRADLSMPMKK